MITILNFRYFEGSSVVAGFLPDSQPLQLRGIPLFQFCEFTSIFRKVFSRITTSGDPHFELSLFLRDRQYCPDFCQVPTTITMDFHFSNFTTLRVFSEKYFSRITTSGDPHFELSLFLGVVSSGRISARFAHTTITRDFHFFRFYDFTSIPEKYFPESPLPMIPIF